MYSAPSIEATTGPGAEGRRIQLADALDELARRTRFPVVFGGFARGGRVEITELIGNRRDTLRGLVVRAGSGLGGRALQESRPRFTADYRTSRVITHDYDRPVLAEGITTLFAVPVVVGAETRAVLYGGLREAASIGGVSVDPAVSVAARFGSTLGAGPDAEIDAGPGTAELPAPHREELRELYAEIRSIAAGVADPVARARLAAVEARLGRVAGGDDEAGGGLGAAPGIDPGLTPRELDVLSLAALGSRNAAIGQALGITEATVKGYMHAAMQKLGAAGRHEAVVIARRRRLLP
ncbi:helix-turn-helix transcriptional regulator [Agromyces archimandritae]|uniref:Response regulator transcription factor n=1 Tax=Agromyces archimandritae TaxID=2781962 RepID=A0A975INA9_9MICO|nr:LuxR C-terminal-related transcriptional regulator [Agromyces archimandritae]QTX04418.1 response regulator transcription factor [Agromyces archimandritae]